MCASCQMLNINGYNCHEPGCPDAWKDADRECRECGCDFKPEDRYQWDCDDCSNPVEIEPECLCSGCGDELTLQEHAIGSVCFYCSRIGDNPYKVMGRHEYRVRWTPAGKLFSASEVRNSLRDFHETQMARARDGYLNSKNRPKQDEHRRILTREWLDLYADSICNSRKERIILPLPG